MWYVYGDYTDDDRPFYFGKGNWRRFKTKKRNPRHQAISKTHGFRRRLLIITSDHAIANHYEKHFIAFHKTRDNVPGGWGANYTDGGDGTQGFPSPWRGKHHNHGPKISASKRGKPFSDQHRLAISEANRGRKLTQEWIEKRSASVRGKSRICRTCGLPGHYSTTCSIT